MFLSIRFWLPIKMVPITKYEDQTNKFILFSFWVFDNLEEYWKFSSKWAHQFHEGPERYIEKVQDLNMWETCFQKIVAPAPHYGICLFVCLLVCGHIDILCEKLKPGGSVLGLMIIYRKYSLFCKKLTIGCFVLGLMILYRKCSKRLFAII